MSSPTDAQLFADQLRGFRSINVVHVAGPEVEHAVLVAIGPFAVFIVPTYVEADEDSGQQDILDLAVHAFHKGDSCGQPVQVLLSANEADAAPLA